MTNIRLHLSWASIFLTLIISLLATREAKAATFTFDPTITFEVGDGFFAEPFDGRGDADAVFPGNFDTVVLGTIGENSENAEFDISRFTVPPAESITNATFQAQIISTQVFGLGSPGGIPPNRLGVRGYVGNGQVDASDFQAGRLLDTVDTSSAFAGQIITFDVTQFIQTLVIDTPPAEARGILAVV